MGYEELIRDLQGEAEHKKEAVLAAVREEARRIIEDAMRQCDHLEREFQDALARDLDRERDRLLNRARGETRRRSALARSELAQQVFSRLEERLKAAASGKGYRGVLERLLEESRPEWPAGEAVVRADPGTQALLKPLIRDRAVRFEPIADAVPGEDSLGGFELSDPAGMVTIRNTFRSRLIKARPDLLVEMNRLLFEKNSGG